MNGFVATNTGKRSQEILDRLCMMNDLVKQISRSPYQRLLLVRLLSLSPAHHTHRRRVCHDRHEAGTELLDRHDFKHVRCISVAADDQFRAGLPILSTIKTIRVHRFTQCVVERVSHDVRVETTHGRSETQRTPSPSSVVDPDYRLGRPIGRDIQSRCACRCCDSDTPRASRLRADDLWMTPTTRPYRRREQDPGIAGEHPILPS